MDGAARPGSPPAEAAGAGFRRLARRLFGRAARVLLAAQLVAALVLLLRGQGLLQPFELAFHDATLRLHASEAISDRLAIVVADEEDIERFGWPLPDGTMAALIERIFAAGAAGVVIDIYRDRPVGDGHDTLAALLTREPRISWAYRLGDATHRGIRPPAALAGTPRAAFADVVTDPGEVIRRALIVAEDPESGRIVLSLGASLAVRLQGSRLRPEGDDLGFGDGVLNVIEAPFGPYSVLDAGGYQLLLDFHGRFARHTVAEVIDGRAGSFAGMGVLVGLDTISVKDSFTTPLTTGLARRAPIPGVAIHAHTAELMLRVAAGEAGSPHPLPRAAEDAMVFAAATAGAAVPLLAPVAAWGAVAGGGCLALLALVVGGAALAYGSGLLLPAVPVALGLLGAAVVAAWLLQGIGHRQRTQLRRVFEHYLDPRIVRAMVTAEQPPALGGEHREITAIFTDIAGFTTLAETLPAPELAALLNEYFEGMGEAVVAEGGLVADFIGDGMMALFGAPLPQPDHATRAVAAALAADRFARGFAERLAARGIGFGITRIGVHTGMALVGNLGMKARLKYTALGDTLNSASRLESLNRYTGTRVLVSGQTAARATGHRFRLLGDAALVGRAGRMGVLVPDAGDPASDAAYEAALAAIRAGERDAALAAFSGLAGSAPEDASIAFHRRRLEAGTCSLEIAGSGK